MDPLIDPIDADALVAAADLAAALAGGGSEPMLGFRHADARLLDGRPSDTAGTDRLAWVRPPAHTADRQALLAACCARLRAAITETAAGPRRRPSLSAVRRATEQIAVTSELLRYGGDFIALRATDLRPVLHEPLRGADAADVLLVAYRDLPAEVPLARSEAVRRIIVERSLWRAGRDHVRVGLGEAA